MTILLAVAHVTRMELVRNVKIIMFWIKETVINRISTHQIVLWLIKNMVKFVIIVQFVKLVMHWIQKMTLVNNVEFQIVRFAP